MSENSYENKYNALMASLDEMHKRNVHKTSAALKSFLIIPTIFLIFVFLTNSSKTVFLVLWIASMFIISAILIVTEYQDYTIRKVVMSTLPQEEPEKAPAEEISEADEVTEDADYEEASSEELLAWSGEVASSLAAWADEVADESSEEATVGSDS